MHSITVEYVDLEGTGASVGRAGAHTVIADRPEGKAGGTGLGFNGAELLALSVGGCFCNDVRYTADELGVRVIDLRVRVTMKLQGEPLMISNAVIAATCELADGSNADGLLDRAKKNSTVANSLRNGIDVDFN